MPWDDLRTHAALAGAAMFDEARAGGQVAEDVPHSGRGAPSDQGGLRVGYRGSDAPEPIADGGRDAPGVRRLASVELDGEACGPCGGEKEEGGVPTSCRVAQ